MPRFLSRAQLCYRISISCYIGLLAAIGAWTFWLEPPAVDNLWVIWAVQTIPLLLPLYGLVKKAPRSFAWLCFIVLFYFSAAVVSLYQSPDSLYAALKTALTVTLFISAMLFCRWQAQENRG